MTYSSWYTSFLQLALTPCKAKQPLRGLGLQEKEEEKDEKDTGKLFRKSITKEVFNLKAI